MFRVEGLFRDPYDRIILFEVPHYGPLVCWLLICAFAACLMRVKPSDTLRM